MACPGYDGNALGTIAGLGAQYTSAKPITFIETCQFRSFEKDFDKSYDPDAKELPKYIGKGDTARDLNAGTAYWWYRNVFRKPTPTKYSAESLVSALGDVIVGDLPEKKHCL